MHYKITILDTETGQTESIQTNGVVLLYLEGGKVKVNGKIEIAEVAPLLAKVFMDKLVK